MNDNDKKQLDQEAYLAAAGNYFCDAQRALGSAYQSCGYKGAVLAESEM